MRIARAAGLLALLLAPCGRALAATTPENPALDEALLARIESLVTRTMRDKHIPGLALGIVSGERAVYARGFGLADVRTGRAVTPQTVFQLGSDSKMFVGIAIMQLVAAGRLELDAPVTRYLPYFRIADPRYPRITLRHLLTHSAGLPWCSNYVLCNRLDYEYPEHDAGSLERHIRTLDRVMLESEPGTRMQYSDLGFEILGDVIAKVSGQDFESYVAQRIFAPFGMRHSSFLLRDVPARERAMPHVLRPGPVVNGFFPYSRQHAPSSNLFSSADDMNLFATGLLAREEWSSRSLLPSSAYETMWTAQIATTMQSKWETTLGLGWFLGGEPGHRLVGHAGGDTGFDSEFILALDDRVAVSAMVDIDYSIEEFAWEVLQMVIAAEAPHPTDEAPGLTACAAR